MQSHQDEAKDRFRDASSCEIIQEIHGLGAYYLLREDEEELFQRLMVKYHKHSGGATTVEPELAKANAQCFEIFIRKTLSQLKADFATGTSNALPRKEALLSAAARASSGMAGKGSEDSTSGNRRIRLG